MRPLTLRRPSCVACERPASTCICHWIRPFANDLPVLILQHPLEARQAKGSARLLQMSLRHCRLQVGEQFEPADLRNWIGADLEHACLLYPDTAAVPLAPAISSSEASPRVSCLIVLDATWRKSLRMLHRNPLLHAVPRLFLRQPPPSRYWIRRAQASHQRSTLEAVCLALEQLEAQGGQASEPLLQAFDGFVREQALRQVTKPGVIR